MLHTASARCRFHYRELKLFEKSGEHLFLVTIFHPDFMHCLSSVQSESEVMIF